VKHPEHSVRSIQTRLFILLVRAFAAVVILTLLLVFAVTGYVLAHPQLFNVTDQLPVVTRVETYYRAVGSWEGVGKIIPPDSAARADGLWTRAMLLDANGLVVLDHGDTTSARVGQPYQPPADTVSMKLTVDGQQVGTLVFDKSLVPTQLQLFVRLVPPVVFISIFLALLTILIGLLLMRRFVTPLAEVMAAAQTVASGDLTTRVRVSGPDDLRALSDTFNQMTATLERSDLERRSMMADIAHELRTPLTVIRGRLEGIVDGVYPPDAQQILPALEETYLLERLVEDLRLLTLAETRQLHFDKKDVDLNRLARRVVDLFMAEAVEKQIELSLQVGQEEALCLVDPLRTEQIISNLVGNALRYAPQGSRIRVEVERRDESVILAVSDSGAGVPEQDLPYIFNRFWRGEKSRSRASGGAGLGLAISRQLVEAQGGEISARNLPEGGLQVRCEFPVNA
jgi:signal transduction histidine kinase